MAIAMTIDHRPSNLDFLRMRGGQNEKNEGRDSGVANQSERWWAPDFQLKLQLARSQARDSTDLTDTTDSGQTECVPLGLGISGTLPCLHFCKSVCDSMRSGLDLERLAM
jgi:hypothetical protein